MKNLVRGGIILLMLGVFVVFIYAQTATEETTEDAKVSKIQFNNTEDILIETNIDNTNVGQKNNNNDQKKETTEQKTVKKEEVKEEESTSNPQVKKTGSSRARAVSKGRFVATAYCLRGRTASGQHVAKGIIAADPRVLPLGTRVSLGAGNYSGDYVVRDTGGKIKGNKIDIWMASCAEAIRFGRRSVDLSVFIN